MCCSVIAIVVSILVGCAPKDSQATSGPSEFEQKVAHKTVSMGDWTKASYADKQHFAREYTRLHLGQVDTAKAQDIITFVNGSHGHLSKGLQGKGLAQDDIQDILSANRLHLTCKAGARLMGWPSPLDPMEPEADESQASTAQ